MIRSSRCSKRHQHGASTVEYAILIAIIALAASGLPEFTRTMGDKLVRNDFFRAPLELNAGGGTEGGFEWIIRPPPPVPTPPPSGLNDPTPDVEG